LRLYRNNFRRATQVQSHPFRCFLDAYQRRTGLPEVSLGSFSEAQSVFDPELLRAVLRELMEDLAGDPPASLTWALQGKKLEAIDSSLREVLPRMGWAHWRDQYSTKQNAVRLHLRRRLFEPGAGGAKLVAARECERPVLRHGLLEPGVVYVGDRNYAGDYDLLRRMDEIGSSFIVRPRDKSVIEEIERIPVSEKDRERGITRHQRVALGHRDAPDNGWRLVRLVPGPGRDHIVILTNLPLDGVGAWELCEIYKPRWTIELFFRWLKCLLPRRHWLAESEDGVATQVYCALIAALLLSRRGGKLPTKRMMERLRFWIWAGPLTTNWPRPSVPRKRKIEGFKAKRSANARRSGAAYGWQYPTRPFRQAQTCNMKTQAARLSV